MYTYDRGGELKGNHFGDFFPTFILES